MKESQSILDFLPRDRVAHGATINVCHGSGLVVRPLQFTLTGIETEISSYKNVVVHFRAEVLERDRGVLIPIQVGKMVPLEQLQEDPRGMVKRMLMEMFSHELDEVLMLNGRRNDPHAHDVP